MTKSEARASTLRSVTERALKSERDLPEVVEFNFASFGDLQGSGALAPIWQVAGAPGLHPLIAEMSEHGDVA